MTRAECIDILTNISKNFTEVIQLFDNNDLIIEEDVKGKVLMARDLVNEIMTDTATEIIPDFYLNMFADIVGEYKIEKQSCRNKLSDAPRYSMKLFFNKKESVHSHVIAYNVFKSLDYVQNNTVIVGANGCGKTTLSRHLKQTINDNSGVVIPAQKLLIIPTYDGIPNPAKAKQLFERYQDDFFDDKVTYNANSVSDIPYEITQKFGSEFNYVYGSLLSSMTSTLFGLRETALRDKIAISAERFITPLDQAIEIWNDLMQTRKLVVAGFSLQVECCGINYEFYKCSDGERELLYLIARVLLAPMNSLIMVDEPEMYLHKTIVDKLWNTLEIKRKDCVFVYLTHDLEFATSRNATKFWVKNFKYPNIWEFDKIEDSVIPEELLMKLLGSKKRILFCEGKNNSYDKPIFESIFPQYTIVPVESCKNVVNYTKAFNKMPSVNVVAFGIIDSDFRSKDEIIQLKESNVYAYDVAEIENLFLIEEFVLEFCKYKHFNNLQIDQLKNSIIEQLDFEKTQQASKYVTTKINYLFSKDPIEQKQDICDVKMSYSSFICSVDIDKWNNDRLAELNEVVRNGDYAKAISLYNNKGLFRHVESWLQMRRYQSQALDFLRDSLEAQNILRGAFPEELYRAI